MHRCTLDGNDATAAHHQQLLHVRTRWRRVEDALFAMPTVRETPAGKGVMQRNTLTLFLGPGHCCFSLLIRAVEH
jgi:hypothetical protein